MAGSPVSAPMTLDRLPQEIWDRILSDEWSLPGCDLQDYRAPQFLSSCRLINKKLRSMTNDIFIRRNFTVIRLELVAKDPAATAIKPDPIVQTMQIMSRLRPDDPNRTLVSYVKTIWFRDQRVRQRRTGQIGPPLSPAAVAQLRIQVTRFRNLFQAIDKLIFEDAACDTMPTPPSFALSEALRVWSRGWPLVRGLVLERCELPPVTLAAGILTHWDSLRSLELTVVRAQVPTGAFWTIIFQGLRDHGIHLVEVKFRALYILPPGPPALGGLAPPLNLADYTGPRPIRAFKNPAQTDATLRVESYHLGRAGRGASMKGRFAVRAGLNQLLQFLGSPQFNPALTVDALKAAGTIV